MSAHTTGSADTPVTRSLRLAMHGLFVLLLVIGTVRGAAQVSQPALWVLGCVALGAWYAFGLPLGRSRRLSHLWFAVLFLGWVLLVVVSVELSWVAFALFFIGLHVLPRPLGLLTVAAATAVVVIAQLSNPDSATVPSILGPSTGALVAIGIAWVYKQLQHESENRRLLNADLVAAQSDLIATHDALAGAQRESGVLAERARLARDVHDTLAQSFSSIVLLARAGLAGSDDSARLREVLTRIEQTAADGLGDARTVVHALVPQELEQAPLAAALGRLVERQEDQPGPTITLSYDPDLDQLPTAAEVTLLRLAQGALANVRQHAHAEHALIRVEATDAGVALEVRDDGRGFDSDKTVELTDQGGFGLAAMAARADAAGGTFELTTAPGEGTIVRVELPLAGGQA